jgi:hypothetical protein
VRAEPNAECCRKDLEETGVTLIAPAWPLATLRPAAQLFIADHRQYRPQPLVVCDRALIDLTNLIEGAVSPLDAWCRSRVAANGLALFSNRAATGRFLLSDCRPAPASLKMGGASQA